jgi:curved DNA-binding protein
MDPYSVLGVAKDASAQDIKKAFRTLARECHPDVAGDDPTKAERFRQAREAYETLIDPEARARVDRPPRAARNPGDGSFFDAFFRHVSNGGHGEAPWDSVETTRKKGGGNDTEGNNVDLEDLFSGFGFGGAGSPPRQGAPGSGPGRGRPGGGGFSAPGGGFSAPGGGWGGARPSEPQRPRSVRGADVRAVLEVPLDVARAGGAVALKWPRWVRREMRGQEHLEHIEEQAEIRVIPGVQNGALLIERGLGDAGVNGGPYGDLLVTVRIGPSRAESRPRDFGGAASGSTASAAAPGPGADARLEIGVGEALLGGRVEVDAPGGRMRVAIPPCTSSGARLRLKGCGAARPDGTREDYVVEVAITVPRELDEESKRLIEEFARRNP